MSYTKGPWRVIEANTPGVLYVSGPAQTLTIITTAIDLDFADYVKRTSDAHLISAAPELLEALEDLLSLCDAPSDCSARIYDGYMRAADNAAKAIAKAKGEMST